MLRIQYEQFVKRLHVLIGDEFDIETEEAQKVFRELTLKLFQLYIDQKKSKPIPTPKQ